MYNLQAKQIAMSNPYMPTKVIAEHHLHQAHGPTPTNIRNLQRAIQQWRRGNLPKDPTSVFFQVKYFVHVLK